jgi:hypothetical protein
MEARRRHGPTLHQRDKIETAANGLLRVSNEAYFCAGAVFALTTFAAPRALETTDGSSGTQGERPLRGRAVSQ